VDSYNLIPNSVVSKTNQERQTMEPPDKMQRNDDTCEPPSQVAAEGTPDVMMTKPHHVDPGKIDKARKEKMEDSDASSSGDDDDDDEEEATDNAKAVVQEDGTLHIPQRYTKSGRKRSVPFPVRVSGKMIICTKV
jgi:hypothetical protein